MKWQGRSRRSYTGAKIKAYRSKRIHEQGRESADTRIAAAKRKNVATAGGNRKVRLLQCDVVNVTDAQGKTRKASILTVTGNAANEHYVWRKILTKGAVIKTDLGDAKVTSRPGQDGVINAVLVK